VGFAPRPTPAIAPASPTAPVSIARAPLVPPPQRAL
jgi:hypothetical protein